MKRIICLLPALVVLATSLSGQNNDFWMKFPGPSGGTFQNIVRTGSGFLYGHPLISTHELYRSADQGLNWSKLDITRDSQPVSDYIDVGESGAFNMLVFDSTLLRTLYRSLDEGVTWELVQHSLPYREVYETPGGALLAKTNNYREIWRSTDSGLTWTFVWSATTNLTAPLRILQTGDLIFTNTNGETYRSWDDGQSWQVITQTSPQKVPLYITRAGTFLVINSNNIYRSTDNGLTWDTIITPNVVLNTPIDLASGQLLALAASGSKEPQLYYSNDEGQTWLPRPSDHSIWAIWSPFVHLVPLQLPDGTIFGYCNGSLYRSANGGLNWQFSAYGLQTARTLQMAFVAEDTFFAMTMDGLWRTFDNGQQWTKLTDHTTRLIFDYEVFRRSFVAGDNGRLAIALEDSLYWSDDYGAHFVNRTPANLASGAIEISPDNSILFANSSTPFKILRSVDNGQSWQVTIGGNINFKQLEFHPSGRIYGTMQLYGTGATLPSVWYSDNLGINWFPANVPVNVWFKDLHIDPSGIIYAVGEDANNNGIGFALYRSTDNGQNWLRHPDDSGFFWTGPIAGNAAGHLFFANNDIQRSLDQGATWAEMPFVNAQNIMDPVSPEQYLFMSFNGLYRTVNPTTSGAYIGGYIRRDADADCSTPDAQTPLNGWAVKATGVNTFYGTADSVGHYLMFVDTGAYSVQMQVPNATWWAPCETAQPVLADSLLGLDTLDFSAIALAECPLVTVDISVPLLRRCFTNSIFVYYRNEGTETADSAWVDVQLDPFTNLVSASLPYIHQGGDIYRFPVGNLPFGTGGQFSLQVYLGCDSTVLGQTHCFSAHAYPDTLCTPVNDWSGAEIQANISCQDTVVQFELRNVGDAPSQTLDYIIIIDDVVLMHGSRQYDPGEALTLTGPANGQTWRIESEQEPGHPFSNLALAFAEGCGGYNSLGYINQFPVNGYHPSHDVACLENTGSFDPNDKQGFPLGFGAEHRVRPGQELEYLIRFQNTGTDTAFMVVIRDTLSPWLDPASVRPGAASHPYTWDLSGPGVLRFSFDNILLPDSNVNEATSHGYVSFRIAQQPDVPLGAEIFNDAAIYFDFNPPVLTNSTLHTVGYDYLVNTYTLPSAGRNDLVLASPNPASDRVQLRLANGAFNEHRITITDARGLVLRQSRVNGAQYLFQRDGLPAGVYFYRVEDAAGRAVGSGKLVLKG